MPSISSFTGQQLLDKNTVAQISREAEILLQNKDIAGAWQGSKHLKDQLSQLPASSVAAVLPDYRKISANLKALALPLLDKDEVTNLLQNNLIFLESRYEPYLLSGLGMWLLGQPDGDEAAVIGAFKGILPKDNPLSGRVLKVLEESSQPARSGSTRAGQRDVPSAAAAPIMPADKMFDDHEAKELARESKKIGEIGATALAIDGAGGAADAILKLVGREQDQEAFLRRTQALVKSRLRDVRTIANIKEYLHRPWAVGGLGIDEEQVEAASQLIEQEYQKVHATQPGLAPAKPMMAPLPVIATSVEPAPPAMPAVASVVSPPVIKPVVAVPEVPATPLQSGGQAADRPAEGDSPAPRIIRPIRTANFNNKPRLDDVKSIPNASRSVSTADEFKLMTMADFRALGAPAAAVKEILRKAELLRQESLENYMRALKLWRESELMADYIALGQSSLTQGKKLAQVLSDAALNPRGLTEDEFFAIAGLNGKLK